MQHVVRRSVVVLGLLPMLAACGETLASRVEKSMDGCLAQRNPLFVAGRGAEAVQLPLTPEVEAIARKLDYPGAFRQFKGLAEKAATQAILTCALDLAAHFSLPEGKEFVQLYTKHPNADVAAAAQRYVARYK